MSTTLGLRHLNSASGKKLLDLYHQHIKQAQEVKEKQKSKRQKKNPADRLAKQLADGLDGCGWVIGHLPAKERP